MKTFWSRFKYSLFSLKFNFFDIAMLWSISTIAKTYGHWYLLLLVPMIVVSVTMEWRVRKENEDAQASDGTVR